MSGQTSNPSLSDYEADELMVKVELAEPLFPDEEGFVIEDHIEMDHNVENAEIVDHNAEGFDDED